MYYQDHENIKEGAWHGAFWAGHGFFAREAKLHLCAAQLWGCTSLSQPRLPPDPLASPHTLVAFASPLHIAGKYALPWDMASLNHRQFNPLYVLQRSAAFLNEATQTLRRRWGGGDALAAAGGVLLCVGVWAACLQLHGSSYLGRVKISRRERKNRFQAQWLAVPAALTRHSCTCVPLLRRGEGKADPIWLKSGLLPSYYGDGFHYQTDGWRVGARQGVWEACQLRRASVQGTGLSGGADMDA